MKKLILIILVLLTFSCSKEKQCDTPDRKYCYRELTTHNVVGCTYISPCDEERKREFRNSCPTGYEVIWNP